MRVEDMVLISTDDHVVEPPSLSDYFKDHVPAKFRDRIPKVIRRNDGTDDLHERIRDMDVNGVLASLCFPSWPGIAGKFFMASDDTEYASAMVVRYPLSAIRRPMGPP